MQNKFKEADSMAKEIVFIVDKSGSMSGSEVAVVTGYNELLAEQKAEAGDMLITTVFFNLSPRSRWCRL
jgi:Mg-chelatase subunit ChlD